MSGVLRIFRGSDQKSGIPQNAQHTAIVPAVAFSVFCPERPGVFQKIPEDIGMNEAIQNFPIGTRKRPINEEHSRPSSSLMNPCLSYFIEKSNSASESAKCQPGIELAKWFIIH